MRHFGTVATLWMVADQRIHLYLRSTKDFRCNMEWQMYSKRVKLSYDYVGRTINKASTRIPICGLNSKVPCLSHAPDGQTLCIR